MNLVLKPNIDPLTTSIGELERPKQNCFRSFFLSFSPSFFLSASLTF